MNDGFIALDWGSSNFRAYQIDRQGKVADQVSSAWGIAKIDRDEIPTVLNEVAARWPEQADAIYCCGMIGSTIGWSDVPYIECPVAPRQLAEILPILDIGEHRVNVSPGLRCTSIYGQPDVMRGEEMQFLGYLYQQKEISSATGMICMPGTHSKWLVVEQGSAAHFSTAMTGDIFAAMSLSGLLKPHLGEKALLSPAFLEGIEYAKVGGAAARQLFSVRSRVVVGQLADSDASSFASGILIGGEINDALAVYSPWLSNSSITLIGSPSLCGLYQAALTQFDLESTILNAGDACIDGFKFINSLKGGH